jgi:hypothetical protein
MRGKFASLCRNTFDFGFWIGRIDVGWTEADGSRFGAGL